MAARKFETKTDDKKGSVVDAKLKPDAQIYILVGGPYTLDGEEHRYGHTAIRIKSSAYDLTYDFGRYGKVTGTFKESGEGILRVWSSFSTYIAGENALGRTTDEFMYKVFKWQSDAVKTHFDNLIAAGELRKNLSTKTKMVYRISPDYHALGPNCTTISMDGAKAGIKNIDVGAKEFIKPEKVLTLLERGALTAAGGSPDKIFLPANLKDYLNSTSAVRSDSSAQHGGGIK